MVSVSMLQAVREEARSGGLVSCRSIENRSVEHKKKWPRLKKTNPNPNVNPKPKLQTGCVKES